MFQLVHISALFLYLASGLGQTPTDIRTLYEQLNQPTTSGTAARSIQDLASHDATAKEFVAQRIPSLIRNRTTTDFIWMNAVRLAGQLKIINAIPALKQALSRGPVRGGYDYDGASVSLSDFARLRYDIVGRALADIGDPSVPAVADVLSTGDSTARKRAAWILANIDSPAAQKAMRDHLPSERDPEIKQLIQQVLHISQ